MATSGAKVWTFEHVTATRVQDGDSIWVDLDRGMRDHWVGEVRIAGIDAWKGSTDRGRQATIYAAQLLAGGIARVVSLKAAGEKYGRLFGHVVLTDGRDLATELMAAGLALPWDGTGQRPTERPENA